MGADEVRTFAAEADLLMSAVWAFPFNIAPDIGCIVVGADRIELVGDKGVPLAHDEGRGGGLSAEAKAELILHMAEVTADVQSAPLDIFQLMGIIAVGAGELDFADGSGVDFSVWYEICSSGGWHKESGH